MSTFLCLQYGCLHFCLYNLDAYIFVSLCNLDVDIFTVGNLKIDKRAQHPLVLFEVLGM
jgi:hypothetical protein